MQWGLNGNRMVDQASIFHLTGMAHEKLGCPCEKLLVVPFRANKIVVG
jgi:hypothetical protein